MKQKENKISIILSKIKQYLISKKHVAVLAFVAIPVTSVGGMSIYIDNAQDIAQQPIIFQDSIIALDEVINVKFVLPINDTKSYEQSISIYPKSNMYFQWNEYGTELKITPKTIWQPDTDYSFAFPYNKNGLSTIFSFHTISYPNVLKTNIEDRNNLYIKEGEEIIIQFDKSVEDFDIQAIIRPVLDVEQNYDDNNHELHVKIKQLPKEDELIPRSLTVFAKHKIQKDVQFYPIASRVFNVFMQKPDEWPQEFDDRLEIARKSTIPQIIDGKYIDVNLDAQITTLFENGKFVKNFMNSTGADDTPTPTGTFAIYNKNPYALSNMFQVYMPYWMAFTEDGLYGFHGLIVWPEGHEEKPEGGEENENNIGNAVSPGCVRHDAQNTEFIYNWADIGTKVIIY